MEKCDTTTSSSPETNYPAEVSSSSSTANDGWSTYFGHCRLDKPMSVLALNSSLSALTLSESQNHGE